MKTTGTSGLKRPRQCADCGLEADERKDWHVPIDIYITREESRGVLLCLGCVAERRLEGERVARRLMQ